MSRLSHALAAFAVAGVAALGAPAHAANPTIVCRQVTAGAGNVASVCVGYSPNSSGGTVDPTVYWGCTIGDRLACTGKPIAAGATGFVPNPAYPLPTVDVATASVRVWPGTIGTLWVAGTQMDLVTSGFCVGDPAFC